MKRMIHFFLGTALALILLPSCNNDEGEVSPLTCGANFNYLNSVDDELNAVNNAVTLFTSDPSPTNCDNLKQAYQEYINALKDVENCVPTTDRAAWRQALDDAEDNVDNIC
jgi:hypothetical protein